MPALDRMITRIVKHCNKTLLDQWPSPMYFYIYIYNVHHCERQIHLTLMKFSDLNSQQLVLFRVIFTNIVTLYLRIVGTLKILVFKNSLFLFAMPYDFHHNFILVLVLCMNYTRPIYTYIWLKIKLFTS